MKTLLIATIVTLMVGQGLGLEPAAVAALRHRPGLAARLVLGACLLVPLAGLLLLELLPGTEAIPRGVRLAILTMAMCPSAPLTLRRAGRHGGERELAAGLQLLAAATAVLSIPLLAKLFQDFLRAHGWAIPPTLVATQVLGVQGLPLALGMAVRWRWPRFAARWRGPIDRGGLLLMVLIAVVILLDVGPKLFAFLATSGTALVVMALLTLVSMAIGARLAAPGRSVRVTGALLTSMRNPGLALLFASLYAEGIYGVRLGIVVYQLITVLLGGLVLKVWNRRTAP